VVSSELKRARPQPVLVVVNNRQIASHGLFNPGLMADFVGNYGRSKWLKVGELARTAYGQNTERSRSCARRALPRLFWVLFQRRDLLIYEYGEHGRVEAVKICNVGLEHDCQCAEAKLTRMKQRKEMSTEQYNKALTMLGLANEAP
jgi:hypothetical protein